MSKQAYIICALSIVLVLTGATAIYWPGLNGPFLFDDQVNIRNAYVDYFIFDEVIYALTHNESGMLGRPVSVLSLVFSGIVHGPDAWGYKYHNLAIHLINGLLVFWLLLKLLLRIASDKRPENLVLISGLVATIWLLHPLMVSTVLYAVQRMAQLSTLFTLAALISYMSAREVPAENQLKFYTLAFGAFPVFMALAVFSKENGALIPFYILAIELLVYRFNYGIETERNRLYFFLGAFVILPLIAGAIYTVSHFDQLSDYSQRNFNMLERLMTQLHVVLLYLKMILLPRLSDMTLFHDYLEVTRRFDLATGILLLIFLGAIFLVFYLRKRAPVAAFAIAWFVVSHLMESTFISLELMFEHRNYLAAVGPLLALVYYLCSVPSYPQLRYVIGAFMLISILMTAGRVGEWRSEASIVQIAILEHPESTRARTQMANLYFNAGQTDEAFDQLAEARKYNKEDFGLILHEVVFRCGSGVDMESLLTEAKSRAEQFPATVYSLNFMDNLLLLKNFNSCPELKYEDLIVLVEAAKEHHRHVQSDQFFGYLENVEGKAYMAIGQYAVGIPLILSAYERTGVIQVLGDLAELLLQLGLLGDAEVVINEISLINAERNGTENALLIPLQDKLREAMLKAGNTSAEQGD